MDSPRSQLGKLAPPGAVAVASTPPPPAPETLRSEGEPSGTIRVGSAPSGADRENAEARNDGGAKSEAVLKSLSTNLVPELRRYVAVHRQEIERLVRSTQRSQVY